MFSKLFNRIKNKIFRCRRTLCVWKLYECGAQTHSYGMNLISHSNWIELIHSIADVLVRFVRYIFDFKSLFFWFDFFIVGNRMGILFTIAVNAQKETDDLQYWKILFFLYLSIFHLFYLHQQREPPRHVILYTHNIFVSSAVTCSHLYLCYIYIYNMSEYDVCI